MLLIIGSMQVEQIDIPLGERVYPVCIGSGILEKKFRPPYPSVALITEPGLMKRSWWASLENALRRASGRLEILTVLPGEKSKSMEAAAALCSQLIQKGFNRETTLVAVGGGMVGDLAGFVAATYLRGVPWMCVPTTLLAAVDSSVGGKVGVNLPEGKNLVGAIHQPSAVLIDTLFLRTLPAREMQSGMAEVIKHGLIADAALFEKLEASEPSYAEEYLQKLIARSVRIKADIVAADEKERNGRRRVLNFGHTLGHALEQAGDYARWLHGETVAIGIVMAAELSAELVGLPRGDVERIRTLLLKYQLPVSIPPELEPQALYNIILRDKKATARGISWILLRQIAQPISSTAIDFPLFQKIFNRCQG